MSATISEDDIKKYALRYLKTHYKFKPRISETIAKCDMVTSDGIIADGHISFSIEEGKTFLATFEATSYDSRHEVKYGILWQRLLWDATTFASALTLVSFLYAYYRLEIIDLPKTGFLVSIGLLLSSLLCLGSMYVLFFKYRPRYRRIYAIEQFKLYHADEQWIAMGFDVFSNHADRQFVELKRQCVNNGFGLLIVDANGMVSRLIMPAREQVLQNRHALAFFDRGQVIATQLSTGIQERFKHLVTQFNKHIRWQQYPIFKRQFSKQRFIILASFVVITSIFLKEYDRSQPAIRLSRYDSLKMLSNVSEKLHEEGEDDELYEVDTSYVAYTNSADSLRKVKQLANLKFINPDDLTRWKLYEKDSIYQVNPHEEVPAQLRRLEQPKEKNLMPTYIPVVVPVDGVLPPKYEPITLPTQERLTPRTDYSEDDTFVAKGGDNAKKPTTSDKQLPKPSIKSKKQLAEPCQPFAEMEGSRFIVQDNVYATLKNAEARRDLLRQKGFEAHVLWLGCFEGLPDYHAVIYKRFFVRRTDADALFKTYLKYLKNKNLHPEKPLIREVHLKR